MIAHMSKKNCEQLRCHTEGNVTNYLTMDSWVRNCAIHVGRVTNRSVTQTFWGKTISKCDLIIRAIFLVAWSWAPCRACKLDAGFLVSGPMVTSQSFSEIPVCLLV